MLFALFDKGGLHRPLKEVCVLKVAVGIREHATENRVPICDGGLVSWICSHDYIDAGLIIWYPLQ